MIRKLRWKFVAVCMGLVALVLSAPNTPPLRSAGTGCCCLISQ